MLKYIIKKMITDYKDTIGNMVVNACIMSMLTVCICIMTNISVIIESDIYKNGLSVANVADPFIREKMGAIFGIMNMLSILLIMFFSVLYFLKLKSDIIKERQRIAMFQVLGYSDFRRGLAVFTGKMLETIIPTVAGFVIANSIWQSLCKQKTFYTLMSVLDEEIYFKVGYVVPAVIILMVITFIGSMVMMRKRMNLVSELKGEE